MVHTLSHVRYATQLRGCTNCAQGFLNSTKPSKLAIHGSISPCPGFHAGAFLCFMCIILQYLSGFAIRSIKTYACALAVSWLANANAHLLWWIANSTRRQAHGFCFIKRYLCVTLFQGPTARTVIFLAGCSDMDHRLAV